MSKPHKHAEVIKAWADGAEIEYRTIYDSEWFERPQDFPWLPNVEFRVKPEPPARAYPETRMNAGDLIALHNIVLDTPTCTGGRHHAVIAVANAAIRHAIDEGQVVVMEEYEALQRLALEAQAKLIAEFHNQAR